MTDKNVIDFNKIHAVKEFVEHAQERIGYLEDALYAILDVHRLDVAKEIAADALNEDLDIYLEEDLEELDFDAEEDDSPWADEYNV